MKRAALIAFAFVAAASAAAAQSTRVASDFEIAQMEKQLARGADFSSQLAGRLNLGDLRAARNEPAIATAEFRRALQLANQERLAARRASSLERYATATAYASLAEAKLGHEAAAIEASDEALRYTSDSPRNWNLRASALTALQLPRKAVGAARNAVAIATAELARSPGGGNELDLAIYRYALAGALVNADEKRESEALLQQIVTSLRGARFETLRRQIARNESFEVYSTARGEGEAYNSVLNRSQLLLASLYEERGDDAAARGVYRDVLAARSDDPNALAGMARLATGDDDRDRYFAEAFDANPFSMALIREFRADDREPPADDSTTGARVRKALVQMQRGKQRAARTTLDGLLRQFPNNDTVQYLAALNDIALGDDDRARSRRIHSAELRSEIAARLVSGGGETPRFLADPSIPPTASDFRKLIALFTQERLTPEQRATLDRLTLTGDVIFDAATPGANGTTVFESGTLDGVPFAFSEPTAFQGTLAAKRALRLTYRILGATERGGADALLLEPLKLEPLR